MAAFCPNFADGEVKTDFASVKKAFDTDVAYYLWDRFQGDMQLISDTMKRLPKKAPLVATGKQPASGATDYTKGKGRRVRMETHKINDLHNQYVWDAEKRMGNTFVRTVNGVKVKFWKSYSREDAIKLKNQILSEYAHVKVKLEEAYDGGTAVVMEGNPQSYDETIAANQAALEKDASEYRWELNNESREDLLPDPMIDRSSDLPKAVDNVEEEVKNVNDVYHFVDGNRNKSAADVLNFIKEQKLIDDPRLKELLDFLIQHASRNSYLTVGSISTSKMNQADLDAYMYFDPNTHEVVLVQENRNLPTTYDYFIRSVLHEYIHGYTIKAIKNPQTAEEEALSKKITNLYNTAVKHANNPKMYGYDNPTEFVAELFSRSEFVSEVKSLPFKTWYRVLNAIMDFFGIKTRFGLSIDEQTINAVMNFIPTTEDFVDLSQERAEVHLMPLMDVINNIRKKGTLNDREEFVSLVRGYEKFFTFKGGTKHKESGFAMTPVTSIIGKYGMGIEEEEIEEGSDVEELIERANNAGNVVHGTIESILTGQTASYGKDNPFVGSTGLRADLSRILARFAGEEVTVMSEVFVADPRKAISGKIDLVVIDSKNKVHLYDFKTKEKGFDNYDLRFRNRADGSLKYSARHRAQSQLTMYKQIWEDMTGTQVSSMNVMMLVPHIEERNGGKHQVVGASLSSKYDKGVDTSTTPNVTGARIYDSLRNVNTSKGSVMSGIPGIKNPSRSFRTEQELKRFEAEALTFSRVENALNELFTSLEKQLETVKQRGTIAQSQELDRKLEEVRREQDSVKALDNLLSFALVQTADIEKLYFSMKKKGEPISIGKLFGWRDTVNAFNGFSEYARYLADKTPLIRDEKYKKEYEALLVRLKELNNRMDDIKSRYESEGMKKLVDFLVPYFNGIRAEVRNEGKLAYRKLSASEKKNMTESEYVNDILEESEENIDFRTRALLTKEMKRASRDINTLGMWLDNVLDSKDPVIAAMVKSFAKTDHISHVESIEGRDKILKPLRKFEETMGDKLGTVAYEKLYEFLLEKDPSGKLTGFFVDRFNSRLWEDYNEIILETRSLPESSRLQARREWKNTRTTLRKEDFANGKAELLEQMVEDGDITLEQLEEIKNQELEFVKTITSPDEFAGTPTLKDLANQGIVSHEAIDKIDNWIYKNAWNYRDIKPEWRHLYESKQWGELMVHKESNTPQWQLYETLMEMVDQANDMLPYASRIGKRLPGVVKTTSEMLKSGQNLLTVFKESAKNEFGIRADDVERDNFDNEGNPKYFLPIHYVGKVEPELQSYDIPTIIFKFWQSANDFSNKLEILPEMELAKYFVNNRKADVVKKKALKVPFKGVGNKEELIANNNNLSKQINEWFLTCVYGIPKANQGKILRHKNAKGETVGLDVGKLADNLGKYTALNLLGLNLIQGAANTILGEVLQVAENVAGEYMSKKAYQRGSEFYIKNMAGIMGDVGNRGAENIVTRLMQELDTLDEWEGTDFSKRQKYRHAISTNTLFFTTHAGEHEMQGRFTLGLLSDKRAFDKDGKDIGNMLEAYVKGDREYKESLRKTYGDKWKDHYSSELRLPENFSEEKSEWTADDRFEFSYKTRGILSRLHGEYSDLGRVALQRGALGRQAYMFRKFIIPGFKRRWGKKDYVERLGDFVEGNYITTGRFAGQLLRDITDFKFSIGAHWGELTDNEKANVRRTITELAFLLGAIIVSNFAIAKIKEIDDDEGEERMWSLLAYQALRLRAELLFFVNPGDTMAILRSPAASMSVLENMGRIITRVATDPFARYERGPWKGHLKLEKNLVNVTPGYRQFYRIRDQRDQLTWFSTKIN